MDNLKKPMGNPKGRPKKHSIPYSGDSTRQKAIFEDYLSCIANCFGEPYDDREERTEGEPSLRFVCDEFSISIPKARKLLITAGMYSTEQSRKVEELAAKGISVDEIGELTGLKRSSISSYLPYKKFSYKMDELSRHAEDSRKYRERRKAVKELHEKIKTGENAEKALWQSVIAYQEYPFHTSSGLLFSYTVKHKKNGEYSGELIVSRKEGSKTLTKSSVMLAFHTVIEKIEVSDTVDKPGDIAARVTTVLIPPEYKGPKAIGQIFGISYVYSLFWKLGLIKVPKKVEDKLKGKK